MNTLSISSLNSQFDNRNFLFLYKYPCVAGMLMLMCMMVCDPANVSMIQQNESKSDNQQQA